jgi:condensation domain-containing protein
MTERVSVRFEGEGAGAGELSWGQREIWFAMQHQRSSLPVGGAFPLPAGTTVDGVAADLRFAVSRHQSLRTRLRFTADGGVQQVVAGSGEVGLEIVEAGGGDPAAVAHAVYRRYHDTPFSYESEWPIRWAVICQRGTATHLVSVVCHLAADGLGLMALAADLAARDPVTGRAAGPVTGMQPLEQARRQRGAAARRASDAALGHWAQLLRTIPARRFPGSGDKREPRYWQYLLDSPATSLAASAVAARTRVDTSVVLLAAFAVALSEITGSDPVVVRIVVSNRFRPGFADTVSPVNQTSLCVLQVAGVPFPEVVRRAWRAAIVAAKHAYYDPLRHRELLTRVGAERGEDVDISCLFNDRRVVREQAAQPPTMEEITAALTRSALAPGYQRGQPSDRLFLHINSGEDKAGYELNFDTHWVAPAAARACLRAIERVTVSAARDLVTPGGSTLDNPALPGAR